MRNVNTIKYTSNIGQKTGISNTENIDRNRDNKVALVPEYQNLYSGNLLMKGLNSSLTLVGNVGPESESKSFAA